MKPQQYASLKIIKHNIFNRIIPLFLGGIILFNFSCKSDIEKVKLLSEEEQFPDQSMTNAVITQSKKGKVTVKITSPKINRYIQAEEPETIFPQGLHVEMYDSTQTKESEISANYAIYHENDKLWEAKNNVVAINNEGDTLNTEYLIWNEEEEVIYTDRYVRIKRKGGIIHGKGFEANQDFSNWKIKNPTGTIEVEDEQ